MLVKSQRNESCAWHDVSRIDGSECAKDCHAKCQSCHAMSHVPLTEEIRIKIFRSRDLTIFWLIFEWRGLREGTGIRPDYLVSRADKKIEGPLGKKIALKSKNSRRVIGGSVGAEGMATKRANWRKSWNQIQTLQKCYCCHIYCTYLGIPWHQLVRGSPAVSNRESRYPRDGDSV